MKKAVIFISLAILACMAADCMDQKQKDDQRAEFKTEKPKGSDQKETAGALCGSGEAAGGLISIPAPQGEIPDKGDTLVRHLGAEPQTLNTITGTDLYERWVNYYVIDSLLDMDLSTSELIPQAAEWWEVADDKVTFTFRLRKDLVFHDGHPADIDDVIYALDLIMDPKVDAAHQRTYYMDMESYEKIDDYTIRVKWKKPYFKALITLAGTPVIPKHILDDGTDFNKHSWGRHPIGTGPYKLLEWDTGQKIVLEKNQDYWGEGHYFDRIHFKIITNEDVALQVLKKGELDFIQRLNRIQWLKQTDSKDFLARFNKLRYDWPGFSYIGWNLRKPLFQDKRVRQAMTMLMNREAMLKEIFYCMGTIATGSDDYKTPYYNQEVKPWPFDPERAKKLLAEAGWEDTDGDGWLDKDGKPFRFELSFTAAVPEWENMAVMFKEDLKKAGIDMKIKKLEWATFLESINDWKFDACALAWGLVPYPDYYQTWHSSQADLKPSSNHVGFKNEEVDRLIELNREEFDINKRIEYSHRIHEILHQEQPYTFFIAGQRLAALDKRIHNVIPHPTYPVFDYKEWYVPRDLQKYRSQPGP
jgi:peptide/nickel transport system substrate-binding protein